VGQVDQARQHLLSALRSCEVLHALPHLALTQAELAELTSLLPAATGSDPQLTSREREIAALVAAGLSNAANPGRLTLSERTVENHVSHILRKLGCSSRAGVASWYSTSG
jgi:DNA-binding NarL/FixJ family response regulator